MTARPSRLLGFLIFALTSVGVFYASFHASLPDIKRLGSIETKGALARLLGKHQRPPPEPLPTSAPFGSIVIASGADSDLRWTPLMKDNWTVYEYDVRRPNHDDPNLRFPASKGHEAMIYLSYIVDNYDELPWSVFFMHGHDESWHQEGKAIDLVRGLNRSALADQGYISLRCEWYPSCPAEMQLDVHESLVFGPDANTRGTEAAIAGNWRLMFPGEKLPEQVASPCCAQFAVTRQAIMSRPKADYERLRAWLISSLLDDKLSGRVLEKLWAYIFTGESVHCPPPEQCACEWFGRCNATITTERNGV